MIPDVIAEKISHEVRAYLKEPKIPRSQDPLIYWKENGSKYPTLFPKAVKYLCAPLSTAASERQFSIAGRIQAGRLMNELILY